MIEYSQSLGWSLAFVFAVHPREPSVIQGDRTLLDPECVVVVVRRYIYSVSPLHIISTDFIGVPKQGFLRGLSID